MIWLLVLLLSLAPVPAHADDLSNAIAARRDRVEEFRFIRAEAEKLGVRAWLFGGTAAGFAHYVKWDLQREAGDKRLQPGRFDYDYTNIYRSTQDLDLVVDGTPDQAKALEDALRARYPHTEGEKLVWEVRLLRTARGDKEALLENPNFSNQHTDSNSTGMIELTDSPEPVVRDLRDWQSERPIFLEDVRLSRLHYYFSPLHETTSRFRQGKNPPILSVIRYLTKAFQYDLEIGPADEEKLRAIIDAFEPERDTLGEYVREWIERNGKKLFVNAVNVESAWNKLNELGLREKLIRIRKDIHTPGSLAWWMSKEPLRSSPVGLGTGATARDLGIDIVAHETRDFLSYEAITRAPTGEPNVFISRENGAGEEAAIGDGFYMQKGLDGARGTGFTVRAHLDPKAREGADFVRSGEIVLVKNRRALSLIPESLSVDPIGFFRLLADGKTFDDTDLGIIERMARRVHTKRKALSPETLEAIQRVVLASIRESIAAHTRVNELLLRQWIALDLAALSSPIDDLLFSSGVLWRNARLAKLILERRDSATLCEEARQVKEVLKWVPDSPYMESYLTQLWLSKPRWMQHPGGRRLIEALMEDRYNASRLATHVFSDPYWATLPEGPALIRRLIDKLTGPESSEVAQAGLLHSVLSRPQWARHPEGVSLVRYFLSKAPRVDAVARALLGDDVWTKNPEYAALSAMIRAEEARECKSAVAGLNAEYHNW